MTFSWHMKYFKGQKWRTISNLKRYEKRKQNIKDFVGKYKSWRNKRKAIISAKNNSIPEQVCATTPHK